MRTYHRSLFILSALLTLLAMTAPARAAVGGKEGQTPEINWTTVDRKDVNEETLKGWVRLVVFWDDEDGWTARQAQDPKRAFRLQTDSYYRRGVKVIGYNLNKSPDTARRVSRELRMSWLLVSDPKGLKTEVLPAWSIERPPYAVIMSPDGVVRWRGHPQAMDGSVERVLREYPPQLTREEWVKQAVQIIRDTTDEIESDMRAGAIDYRPALATLSEIQPGILTDPEVLKVAKRMMPYFEPKREVERLSLEAYRESYPQASAAIVALKAAMTAKPATRPSTAAPTEADLQKKREELAQQRLAAAQEHKTAGRELQAYRGFKQTAERYANTPAGKAAAEQITAYEADAAMMEKIKKAEQEEDATSLLRMANNYRSSDNEDKAIEIYKQVIERFPNTEWAEKASQALAGK